MMQKIQKFGGAMFTPVLLFAFAGVVIGLGTLFTTEVIFGALAAPDTLWYGVWNVILQGGWTVFNQLPLLFAVSLPIGLANKQNARCCMEVLVAYLTFNYFVSTMLSQWGAHVRRRLQRRDRRLLGSGHGRQHQDPRHGHDRRPRHLRHRHRAAQQVLRFRAPRVARRLLRLHVRLHDCVLRDAAHRASRVPRVAARAGRNPRLPGLRCHGRSAGRVDLRVPRARAHPLRPASPAVQPVLL